VGLLDSLLGRTKPVRPNLDALFSLPSAAVTLQTAGGLILTGHAGVCWMPPAGQSAADVQAEINQLLEMPDDPVENVLATGAGASATSLQLRQAEDNFGYRWLLLSDGDVDDLVARVHLVNSTLSDNGWGPQLLCSVFSVAPAPDADDSAKPFFLVYLFKRGTFYPFAPIGREKRDTELELRVRSMLGVDLPVESDVSRWFPLWDLPVPAG
jgi:hypothetical protein